MGVYGQSVSTIINGFTEAKKKLFVTKKNSSAIVLTGNLTARIVPVKRLLVNKGSFRVTAAGPSCQSTLPYRMRVFHILVRMVATLFILIFVKSLAAQTLSSKRFVCHLNLSKILWSLSLYLDINCFFENNFAS